MGINDLLKWYKPWWQKKNISSFKGKTVGIDMMVWLYKGAYASLNNDHQNPKSDLYLNYPLKMISLLMQNNINCIAVFDGKDLPAKYNEWKERKQYKVKSIELAEQLNTEGKTEESKKIYKRTLKIKKRMLNSIIALLKRFNIETIIAPYEADAQLSYLYKTKQIDFVITEDSDVIPYGIKEIAFKIDSNGDVDYLDWTATATETVISTIDKDPVLKFLLTIPHYWLVQFCVLLGCDYITSLKGLGVKSLFKLFNSHRDMNKIIKLYKESTKYSSDVYDEIDYIEKTNKAASVFYWQTIYDNINNTLRPLTIGVDVYERNKDTINDIITKNWWNELQVKYLKTGYYGELFLNFDEYCNGQIDWKTGRCIEKIEQNEVLVKYYNRYKAKILGNVEIFDFVLDEKFKGVKILTFKNTNIITENNYLDEELEALESEFADKKVILNGSDGINGEGTNNCNCDCNGREGDRGWNEEKENKRNNETIDNDENVINEIIMHNKKRQLNNDTWVDTFLNKKHNNEQEWWSSRAGKK